MLTTKQNKVDVRDIATATKQHTEPASSIPYPTHDPASVLMRSLGNGFLQGTSTCYEPGQVSKERQGCSLGSCQTYALRRVQANLVVGQPDDPYEQEAERVAEQIIQMNSDSSRAIRGMSPLRNILQPLPDDGRTIAQQEQSIDIDSSGGELLSPATRTFMEPRFGVDFGHVRLHNDQAAYRAASQIQARAFTYNRHIWLGAGESEQNQRLMAHELTHVLQQTMHGATAPSRVQRILDISLPTGIRKLDPTEEAIGRATYGSSLNFNDIYVSDGLGVGGRPFTVYAPLLGTIIELGPSVYAKPGSDPRLLIHEMAHSWQSQHHYDKSAYMGNSVASQAAAAVTGGSAYCYKPGKPFAEYGAEQIANQAEQGVSVIVSHMRSASAGSVDQANVTGLRFPHWEKPGDPGIVC